VERLQGLPGVVEAAASYTIPFEDVSTTSLHLPGRTDTGAPAPEVGFNTVTPGYFQALRTPLLKGRLFDARDRIGAPEVVIVNQALARRFFPHAEAVGQVVGVGSDGGPVEIVGVVGDVRRTGLDSPPEPEVFLALAQDPTPSPTLVVRLREGESAPLLEARRALRELDPALPMFAERPLADVVAATLAARRIVVVLLGLFALVALFLAALGVYAVASQLVVQREHELGVRMAVGASARDLLRLLMADGLRPVVAGTAAGLALALGVARLVESLLYGVTTRDPLTYLGVALVVMTAGLLACVVPGRRAAAVEPTIALRST
jgi:putative ABC transport system permease protein